jgi:hypothetical protein
MTDLGLMIGDWKNRDLFMRNEEERIREDEM